MAKKTDKKQKTPKWTGAIVDKMRSGALVPLDFFTKNAWLLGLLTVIVISLMGLRYKTRTNMGQIKSLNRELRKAESDKLSAKQEYMTLIRQTRMDELVRQNGLNLQHQEQPPFEIETDVKKQNNPN